MKRAVLVCGLIFALASLADAQTINLGIGFSAGLDAPIEQPAQRTGSVFGFRLRMKTLLTVCLEPSIYFSHYGVPKEAELSTSGENLRVTAYGLDLTLGAKVGGIGLKPYGLIGAGYYRTQQGQAGPQRYDVGASAGLGLELGITPVVGLDVRSKVVAIAMDGHYLKFATIAGGFNYYFGN